MGNKNRQQRREAQRQNAGNNNSNKESSMTQPAHTPTDKEVNNAIKVLDQAADAELKKGTEINPEASAYKMGGSESDTVAPSEKKEKGSWIALATEKVRDAAHYVYDKGIKPTGQFIYGLGTRAWGGMANLYNKQIEQAKSMGTLKFLLDKAATLCIFLAKLGIGVTLALIISDVIFNYTGLMVFDPFTAACFAVGGLFLVVVLSIMAQKEQKAPVQAKVVGQHVMERFIGNGVLAA